MIYLLHFPPYGKRGVQHYLGRTKLELQERLHRHRKGEGAALIRAVVQSGSDFVLARTWEDAYPERDTELELKRRYRGKGGFSRICPVCIAKRGLGAVVVGEEVRA